ncbi:MAG: SufD family Fe-S cluster assembly protein [Thermoprotei archaeon]
MAATQLVKQFTLEPPDVTEDDIRRYSKEIGEPGWLTDFRLEAYKRFKTLEVEPSQLFYKYVDLSGVSVKNVEYLRYRDKLSTPLGFGELDDAVFIAHAQGNVVRVPEEVERSGIIVETMDEAVKKHPDLLKQVWDKKSVTPDTDKFAAFTCALFDTGVFIYVPKEVELKIPLRLVFLATGRPDATVSHNLVYAAEHSSVNIIEEGYSLAEGENSVAAFIADVQAAAGAKVTYSVFQGYSNNVSVFSNRRASVGRDASVNWTFTHIGGNYVRSKLDNLMIGSGGSSEDIEVAFGNRKQRFDLSSNIVFFDTNSTGAVYSKAALKDYSKGIMKGMIKIKEKAKASRGFLSYHALLLSREAMADAIPTLEIDTNDVKATHSAAVEQLDQEQLFYIMSKGVDEDTARQLVALAFFEKAVERIPSPTLRSRIRSLVVSKWLGISLQEAFEREDLFEWALSYRGGEAKFSDIFAGHYKYRKTVE